MEDANKNLSAIRLYVSSEPATRELNEVTPDQLNEYLAETKNKKFRPKRKRNQYYELAIMARVDRFTTEAELVKLLSNDVRTLIVQKNYSKPQDLEQIFLNINNCVEKFYELHEHRTPIGVALEINAELLITGRMRNDQSYSVQVEEVIVLTNNDEYKYCCFREVVYVSNLWRYSQILRLGDEVVFGNGTNRQLVTKIVKCGSLESITVKVTKSGMLTSFMSCKVPYYIEAKELSEKDMRDIDEAMKYRPNFLMIPKIRSVAFLKSIKEYTSGEEGVDLLGSIDLQYLESKFIDISECLAEIDGYVLENIICPCSEKSLAKGITQCQKHEKPLIGGVILESCKDYKKLENHMRIKQMDCLLIRKSPVQMKYPLIAKKLLPVGNKKMDLTVKQILSCKEGIINFVLRTICSINCQGIVIANSCIKALIPFTNPQIYCPVIVVVKDDRTARLLNLRRNLKTVVCAEPSQALELGIEFGRKQDFFSTGDFIISISESECEESQICVNLRAYFLPSPIEIQNLPINPN